MLPNSDNGSRFFFLLPIYCLIDVRDAGGTQMVILRRNIPTCLPLYNQANIGQRDRPCLQIVWHSSRRRTVGGVLGYPERNFVADGQARVPPITGRITVKGWRWIVRVIQSVFDSRFNPPSPVPLPEMIKKVCEAI